MEGDTVIKVVRGAREPMLSSYMLEARLTVLLFAPSSDAMLWKMLLQNEIRVRFHKAPEWSYCTALWYSVMGH